MDLIVLVVLAIPLLGILYTLALSFKLMAKPDGNSAMRKVAQAIREGANAYLFQQYLVMGIVGLVILLFLPWLFHKQWWVLGGFSLGAVLSSLAGYGGMQIAIRSNIRTADAARQGVVSALMVALSAGSVTGMLVTSLALVAVGYSFVLMCYFQVSQHEVVNALISLGFGASLVSVFARLGGGIFTKGADIGADLVGKVEAQIPEDDPRNPAVIADNVGDNVGDCAGMAADLFETYVVTLVATMVLAIITFGMATTGEVFLLIMYPLAIGGIGCLATILGSVIARLFTRRSSVMMIMIFELCTVAAISALGFFLVTYSMTGLVAIAGGSITGLKLFLCTLIGLAVTIGLLFITDYYTSTKRNPVRLIAQAATKGAAVNIIFGTAIGMKAVALPTLLICLSVVGAYLLAGMFGIAIAVTSMLSMCGIITTMDAYGPVTDNAGGIAEMSGMDESVRMVTDELDAAGNTTKAITKGYAIGSAALGALVLFSAFAKDLQTLIDEGNSYFAGVTVDLDIGNPYVLIGLLVGGLLPFLFASLSLTSAGYAASSVVAEVRRQFRDGLILKGKKAPDYRTTVRLLTKQAIYRMVVPALLPVLAPIFLYLSLSLISKSAALAAVSAALIGVVISGFALAIYMTTGGAAWDNAKKLVESGEHGGSGSPAHEATVIGDTVGDPFKDTAGPAINPMIKVVNIVTYLLLVYLAS